MAKAVSARFRAFDATSWDVESNHHCCIFNVIALILGAGLKALKLSTAMVRLEKNDEHFPVLSTIIEVPEEDEEEDVAADIVEIENKNSEDKIINPDDAEQALPETGWEWNEGGSKNDLCDGSGIGFTLKKVSFCVLILLFATLILVSFEFQF
jgi:hypothetical protein